MQSKGADIDIVTGKPAEMHKKETDQEREQKEEAFLKRQAEMAGLIRSDAGQILVEMIEKRLQARIEEVITADPEAAGYVKILQDLGNKDRLGREAMKKLVSAKLGQAL
jgi:hypothetical protein